ncbi:MAG TPA: pirin family protein [Beijerinckiaceae bacterium]|jgi:redox-sensitive bicupin YhaK (pirin superfamily)
MSHHPADDPAPGDRFACDAIETVIIPRARDLGGFEVRRALPSARRQMVGPFIFWDQMGPAEFLLGTGMDVRPHPHIGLATVTYLFDGEVMHKDSLGTDIPIRPGALNLMSAGKGIVHSERTGQEARAKGEGKLFGIQAWVALPRSHEESDPAFTHYAKESLPVIGGEGVSLRLIAGEAYGQRSPVATPMAMIYADAELGAGASLPFDATYEERGLYTVSGTIEIAGDRFGPGQLLVFKPGDRITVRALTPARFMLLGGDPMDGPRHIWWNFVSSRRERIEQAKADWTAARFDTVPGESEFIPLPER